jgi:3-phytase
VLVKPLELLMIACTSTCSRQRRRSLVLAILGLLILAGCSDAPLDTHHPDPFLVVPAAETEPMPHSGDSADDPAIWVHPIDPARSTIIGTDKRGGLAVYDLEGTQLRYLPDGEMNNVDLRRGFPLSGQRVGLVVAGDRAGDNLAIYRVDAQTRQLQDVAARRMATTGPYELCMFHSRETDTFYVFVNNKEGVVEQSDLFDNGHGQVDARVVRTFAVGEKTEGCVADDGLGRLYIGAEDHGIWRYGAAPDDGVGRVRVDVTGLGGHLTAQVEGLTIVYGAGRDGYLIASSQGNNTYVVYRRDDNAYVATFAIVAGYGIDGVADTDGIDAVAVDLGPGFPEGVFVAQDGENDGNNHNFKLIPLQAILAQS